MTRLISILIVLPALILPACQQLEADRPTETKPRLLKRISRLEKKNRELGAAIASHKKQISSLANLGRGKRLEKLFHVTKICLTRYTGGIDTDDKFGHDAIKVYLRPLDRDGSTVKAAGSVKIQIFDLALPAERNLIGSYEWSVDEISKCFSGGFVTYHFSFVCPWKKGTLPEHKQLTVRVEFLDYLTGKTFTAQKTCKIKLPTSPSGK